MRTIINVVAVALLSLLVAGCLGGEDCYEEDGALVCVEDIPGAGVNREAVETDPPAQLEDEHGNPLPDDIVYPSPPTGGDDIWDLDNMFFWDVTVITRWDEAGWYSTCVDGCCTSREGTGCCDTGTCSSWCFTTGRCDMAQSRQ